jgi:nitrate reductase NapAB chaperone NapD
MTILGVIVRARPRATAALRDWLARLDGVDLALDPRDGRFVLVIEDGADRTAAATMSAIASHPDVVTTSLVFEYSGGDVSAVQDFSAWRASPAPAAADSI